MSPIYNRFGAAGNSRQPDRENIPSPIHVQAVDKSDIDELEGKEKTNRVKQVKDASSGRDAVTPSVTTSPPNMASTKRENTRVVPLSTTTSNTN